MKHVFLVTGFLLTLLPTFAAESFASVYDLYLLAGQSNMDGRAQARDLTPEQGRLSDSVQIFYRNSPHSSDGWRPLGPGFSIPPKYKGEVPSSTFGPEIGFAHEMLRVNPDCKIMLVKVSKGGTSLRVDWNPGEKGKPESQGTCYRDFSETYRLALDELKKAGVEFRVRGLLWHQGEADSNAKSEWYEQRFYQLVDRIRGEIGIPDLPVVVGEPFDNGKRDSVRTALQAIGKSGALFGLVSAEGTSTSDEGTHFDASSQLLLGQRYAKAILKIHNNNAAISTQSPLSETIPIKAKRKPTDAWKEFETRTIESLNDYQRKLIDQNQYGSRTDRRLKPTGFFYITKQDDRWWLVDPDGYLNINRAVVSVKVGGGPAHINSFQQKFQSKQEWTDRTVELLLANGFNGTGSWSDDEQLRGAKVRIAYCVNWKFMTSFASGRTKQGSGHASYPGDCIPVFDSDWEAFCSSHARKSLAATKDDPFLLAHFFDNELPFKPNMINRYLGLPKNDPGRLAAESLIQTRYGEAASVEDLTDADRQDFDDLVMEKYIGTIARAIKEVDPNHMLLGPRLYSRNTSYNIIGKYIDAFSFNLYGQWSPARRAKELASAVGKPLLVTEFYAKGMDATGLSNDSGAGWSVETQKDRGLFYQNFGLDLLESKVCIGWQWFKYQDNDPADTSTDPSNRNSNKGILDGQYNPYADLLGEMRELNMQVYSVIDHFDGQAAAAAESVKPAF